MSKYGYCPVCGSEGKTRERRPDGYDMCAEGHKYLSCRALPARKKVNEDFKPGDRVLIPAQIVQQDGDKFLVKFDIAHGPHTLWMEPAQMVASCTG